MDQVRLHFVPGGGWACLREISGVEEQAVEGAATVDAIRLLNGLLVATAGALDPGSASMLTAADRDRLLAAVYLRTYGPRVDGTVRCLRCEAPFDLDFSLAELQAMMRAAGKAAEGQAGSTPETGPDPLPDGNFRLASGRRFRLPTGEDECRVAGLPPEEAEEALLRRCLMGDGSGADGEAEEVEAAMEAAAPILDLDLDARCPECGAEQRVHFDLQHYLLKALYSERSQLAWEIHRLAAAYGWSLSEILGLPRSQRRSLVNLAEAESPAGGRLA